MYVVVVVARADDGTAAGAAAGAHVPGRAADCDDRGRAGVISAKSSAGARGSCAYDVGCDRSARSDDATGAPSAASTAGMGRADERLVAVAVFALVGTCLLYTSDAADE